MLEQRPARGLTVQVQPGLERLQVLLLPALRSLQELLELHFIQEEEEHLTIVATVAADKIGYYAAG